MLQEQFHNDEAYQAGISGSDLLRGEATWVFFFLPGEACVLLLCLHFVPGEPEVSRGRLRLFKLHFRFLRTRRFSWFKSSGRMLEGQHEAESPVDRLGVHDAGNNPNSLRRHSDGCVPGCRALITLWGLGTLLFFFLKWMSSCCIAEPNASWLLWSVGHGETGSSLPRGRTSPGRWQTRAP